MKVNKEKNIHQESNVNDRRVFLKKAFYATPSLVALGSMTRVNANNAGSEIVPCPPGQHSEGGICVNN